MLEDQQPSKGARVVTFLRETPGLTYTVREIADALEFSISHCYRVVTHLWLKRQISSNREEGQRAKCAVYWRRDP
jgi:hypothetical protein